MNTTELFLLAMLIVFTLPYLVWRLGRTDYWAPLVVVQIVTGVLLGPGMLGAALPDLYKAIFTPAVIAALNGVAWWAVSLFVFLAGLELDLPEAWKSRRESAVTAGFALFTPLLAGCGAALVLMAVGTGWMGARAAPWQFVLGIGMACAVTALPILILLMEKMGIFRLPLGQRILRYASLDDIAIWGVLAVILLDWERVGKQGVFLLLFTLACVAVRRGLHYMVGAFLAGASLDAKWFDRSKLDQLRHHVLLVLMPVFFLSTGLRTNWSLGGTTVLLAAAWLLLASVGGKLAGIHLAGRVQRWQPGEASLVGWLLQTKALIEIIFANVLLDKQIITSETFTALLLMAVASTMLTVPMVTPMLARLQGVLTRSG